MNANAQRRLAFILLVGMVWCGGVFAQPKETAPPGMGKYLVVLWDPGTPIPGDPSHKVMKRVEEPDYGKGGGRLIEKHDNQRVVYLPFGVAKQLRKHQAVAYIQPIYLGEPLDDWYDELEESGKLKVRADTDTNLTWDRSFQYDDSGNITSIGADQYTYDTAGRLIQSTVAGKTESFKYDAFGNLIEKALTGSPTVTINVDPSTNRMNGGVGYDQGGNVTVLGRHVYEYDPVNMLRYVDSHRLLYDANDERIAVIKDQSLTRWTIRDFDGKVIREFKSDNLTSVWKWESDYFYAEGRLVAGDSQPWGYFDGSSNRVFGGRRYYHLDHLGSVRIVSDNSGRSVAENDYYAFGATATKTFQEPINPGDPHVDTMRFAGHSRDFLGYIGTETDDYLDFMHARQYDPKMGRFLSVDPKAERSPLASPQGWNRYSYAANNPLLMIDPDGRDEQYSVIHVRVNVVYSNADNQINFMGQSGTLRTQTEQGIANARDVFSKMGIALDVSRFDGTLTLNGTGITGSVTTGDGVQSLATFASENHGSALTFAVSGNLPLTTGGTSIVDGTQLLSVLGGNANKGTFAHETAHALGNVIQPRNGLTNAATDFVWFMENLQDALGIGFTPQFEEQLRKGAARLSPTP